MWISHFVSFSYLSSFIKQLECVIFQPCKLFLMFNFPIIAAEGGHKRVCEGVGGRGRWAGLRIAEGLGLNWVSEP